MKYILKSELSTADLCRLKSAVQKVSILVLPFGLAKAYREAATQENLPLTAHKVAYVVDHPSDTTQALLVSLVQRLDWEGKVEALEAKLLRQAQQAASRIKALQPDFYY